LTTVGVPLAGSLRTTLSGSECRRARGRNPLQHLDLSAVTLDLRSQLVVLDLAHSSRFSNSGEAHASALGLLPRQLVVLEVKISEEGEFVCEQGS
jgi:hypothetical protein